MRSLASAALCGVSFFSLAAAAHAQAVPPQATPAAVAAESETGGLGSGEEIIVSARRRDESVQDVPQTVNVVTAAQVEKLNLRNFTDISAVVPGLQLQSTSAFTNTATVRGIAFDPGASGNNPSVEFYLNDAPISSGFLFQSTYDFGQFELQRGPQGTLRGRASPSGSIAVTTRRPDLSEVGVVLNGTISNTHARKLDGAFNIPIIADVLAIRIAGVIDNNQANRVHSLSESANPQFSTGPRTRTQSIRGSVRFEPTQWATFNFMAQDLHSVRHTYDQLISESLLNPAAPPVTSTIIRPFDRLGIDEQGSYTRQDQRAYVLNADFRFAGQRLSYVGSYNKQDFGILAPQDSANFFSPPRVSLALRSPVDPVGFQQVCHNEVVNQASLLTTGAYGQCTHSVAKRKSHELRLASDQRIGGIFDYVIGGFYDHNNNPTDLTTETPIFFSPTALTDVPSNPGFINPTGILRRGTSTEKSAFANITAHLIDDRLELSAGVRYIDYRNQNALFISARTGTPGAVPCAELATVICTKTSDSQHTHATVYTGSVKFKITPDIMVYALTGSSWRPGPRAVGNFSAGPGGLGQTARELFFENLPAETSKSYEIGAKTSFLNRRGRFNISAYHQTFKNYPFVGPQVFYLSTSGTGVVSVATANNPGGFGFLSPVPVTVNGVEAELSYQILEHWSLSLNGSYADGKVKNATIACTDLNGDGIPDIGATIPSVAQLQAAVGAGQTLSQCAGINRRSTISSKFSANIQSEVGIPLSGSVDAFARGLYSFFGKTAANPDNPFDDVGKYGLLNLYAGIRDKDGAWELTLFGKNITREREILTVGNSPVTTTVQIGASGSTFNPQQYRSITVTAPREFGVNLRVAFGSR